MPQLERVQQLPAAPARPDDGHKGTFGRALIVAGSDGMSGAACLAGYGALRGGAGLVTLAIPRGISHVVAAVEPSWLTLPLPDDAGRVSDAAIPIIEQAARNQTVIAIGPGLGLSDAVRATVHYLHRHCSLPMVIDADGLNAFAGGSDRFKQRGYQAPRVLTPHPGEFARLAGIDLRTIQSQRERLAAQFAADHGVTLLLKGPGTIITDGRRIAINATGNSGMATGGSGDVLTGLITSLIAQGLSPFDAAQLGAHLHGLAGDRAADLHGKRSMIASDIHECIGAAWEVFGAGL